MAPGWNGSASGHQHPLGLSHAVPSSVLRTEQEGRESACQVCHPFSAQSLTRNLFVDLTRSLPRPRGVSSAYSGSSLGVGIRMVGGKA